MGKVKFRSSIKALHQALFNFRPPGSKTMTWVCIQQSRTHSFRDVCDSFHSMYHSPSSSSTSSGLCSFSEEIEQQSSDKNIHSVQEKQSSEESPSTSSSSFIDLDESDPTKLIVKHFISSKRFFFSPCGESLSASSSSTTDSDDSHAAELVVKGLVSSKRFFFSPCMTKSIVKESEAFSEITSEMGIEDFTFLGNGWVETEEETGEGGQCRGNECIHEITFPGKRWIETEEEMGDGGEYRGVAMDFCKESIMMAMVSTNPFIDFRLSMEEMVLAHGLREWSCLQELLHCYLRLNDSMTHKIIILAFADLLIHLKIEENNENRRISSSSSKDFSSSLSFSLES